VQIEWLATFTCTATSPVSMMHLRWLVVSADDMKSSPKLIYFLALGIRGPELLYSVTLVASRACKDLKSHSIKARNFTEPASSLTLGLLWFIAMQSSCRGCAIRRSVSKIKTRLRRKAQEGRAKVSTIASQVNSIYLAFGISSSSYNAISFLLSVTSSS
jgi:hypothetical protein